MKNRIKKHKNKFILLTAILSTLLASPTLTLAKSKLGKKKKSSVSNQKLINLSDAIYNVGFKNREQGYMLAQLILNESQKSHIDPNLLVAIIMVESSFNQNAISTTGDLSLAQINVPIWNAEFKRLNHELIDETRIKQDIPYSLHKMTEILAILAERHHSKGDWFGYYHSKNPIHKTGYVKKVKEKLSQIGNQDNDQES